MKYCPELEVSNAGYDAVMDALSFVNPIINVYAMYCIVCRSTPVMRRYRWYLLYHQIVAASLDLYKTIFIRIFTLFPFPFVFIHGLLQTLQLGTAHYLIAFYVFLLLISLTSSVHLFYYRYLVSHSKTRFPPLHKFLLGIVYCLSSIPAFVLIFIGDHSIDTIEKMSQEYTCVSSSFLKTPFFVAYNLGILMKYFLSSTVFVTILLTVIFAILICGTLSTFRNASLSSRTKTLQKQFLIYLCIQVFVPLILMIIPVAVISYILYFQVFNSSVAWIGEPLTSSFGAVGGLLLIFTHPSYRPFHRNTSVVSDAPTVSYIRQPESRKYSDNRTQNAYN